MKCINTNILYSEFQKDNIVECITKGLNKAKFLDGIFDYIKSNNNYDWNPP